MSLVCITGRAVPGRIGLRCSNVNIPMAWINAATHTGFSV